MLGQFSSFSFVTVCDGEQPGPSGLSKRTLRRILRDQQSESDSKTQSEHPDSSDTEAVTEPSKSKRQSLRKSKDCKFECVLL